MAGYQILGIRERFDEKTRKTKNYDHFFERRWRVDNVDRLFKENPVALLDELGVPQDERYNLFYTVSYCEDKKRSFKRAEILAFDLDGIDASRTKEYLSLVASVLKVELAKIIVVFSGRGLHFILKLATPETDREYFTHRKFQYDAICARIDLALEASRLPGRLDRSIFEPARILRLPGTINRKPAKGPDQIAFVINAGSFEGLAFNWEDVSGAEPASPGDTIAVKDLKRFRKNDGGAAMEECLFLKHAKEDAATLPENEWYAAASIVGRFEGGREKFHDLSKGHPGYQFDAAEQKLNQALVQSGPRTCKGIEALWGKCAACPHFGKIVSPIAITSPDNIASEATGFYDIIQTEKGEKLVPNYDDLLRAFYRDQPYFVDQVTGRIYAFNGKRYVVYDEKGLMAWCEAVMAPKPKKVMRGEFAAKVFANHYKNTAASSSFFTDTVRSKVNLSNGVFDLETGELAPHSPDYGFTYVLPYDYDPGATCPTFENFLADVTLGREELKHTLLDFMAYMFVHDYPDHCFLWLTGTGRNGKSTLTDLMELIVGKENAAHILLDSFEERFQIETMNGKLLNVGEETEEKRIPKKQLSMLKALSAGAPTLVEAKGERPYTFQPTAKLVFMANEAPKFGTANQAIKSRLLLVPFDKQLEGDDFSHIDRTLPGRLALELPGIFNLLVRRLREKLAAGPYRVHRNDITKGEVAELLREGDQLLAWTQDNCELAPGLTLCGTAAFTAFQAEVGERFAGTRDGFSKRMRNLYPGKITVRVVKNPQTGKPERHFTGIGFRVFDAPKTTSDF